MKPIAAPVFYLGAMSPYSWIAAERIERVLPNAHWRGLLLQAVFKHQGRTSWGLTEQREAGIAECEARARERGLGAINWPDRWPTSDLMVARAMTFCALHDARQRRLTELGDGDSSSAGLLKSFSLAAMRLAFREAADLAEREVVLEAGRRVGVREQELSDGLQDQQVKDALRRTTEEAIAAGVYGVPTVIVDGKLFWGDDRLQDAASAARSRGDEAAPGP